MVSVTGTKGFKTSQDGLLPNDNDNCHNVDNNEDRDDNDYVNDEDSDNNDNVDKEDGNDNDNVDDEDYNGRSPSILLSKDDPVSGRTKALVVPFFIFTFLTFTFHSVFHNDFFFRCPAKYISFKSGGWQWPCYLPPSFSPGFRCRCYIEKVLTHFMSEKKHLEKITLVLLVSA